MSAASEGPPFISVIIPAYNAAATLGECLEALQNQTVPSGSYEIIVVDDGSTDATALVARQKGARLLALLHASPAAARNLGAAKARGDILMFTDADCAPSPQWIEEMLRPFKEAAVVGVKGAYRTRQRGILPRVIQAEFEDKYAKMRQAPYIDFVDTYAAAYRREVFLANGGFDPSFPATSAEDVEFSFRLAQRGYRMAFAPDAVVYHRHAESLWAYLWKKYRYGVWRARVYSRYPGKVVRDSYTPRHIPLQIVLSPLLVVSLVGAVAVPWLWPGAAVLALAFGLAALPVARRALKEGPEVGLVAPAVAFLRSLAQGAGLVVGAMAVLRGEPGPRPGVNAQGGAALDAGEGAAPTRDG